MSDRNNPGPPLIVEEEFCPNQPPSGRDYVKASVTALLTTLAGACLWALVVFLFQRISGLSGMLIAVGIARLIHLVAGRRRSLLLAIIAAASGLVATLLGFGLLWFPFLTGLKVPRQLTWYHMLMLAVGIAVAFHMTNARDDGAHFHKMD